MAEIAKIQRTKRDKVLIFARSADSRDKLIKLQLCEGLQLREPKELRPTQPRHNGHFVVIQGIHPSVTDEELKDELGLPCRRIVSATNNGTVTWKVKVDCLEAKEKSGILKRGGLFIWSQRFRVVDYIEQPRVAKCSKCQSFDHATSACENEVKCSNCSGSHDRKDCKVSEARCANCEGSHASSSYQCPLIAAAIMDKETKSLDYAAVKRGGDKIESTRLACSIATAFKKILIDRLMLKVNEAEICADVATSVSLHYKVDVRAAHVLSMAMKTKQTPPTHNDH